MFAFKFFILALLLMIPSNSALADVNLRPYSRADASAAKVAEERSRFAQFRAVSRPRYMVRYPVVIQTSDPTMRPAARGAYHPKARWDHKPGAMIWTRSAMSSVAAHEPGLHTLLPQDIAAWCPAYVENMPNLRRAFWAGLMSALAKHESTYNPDAVGGGDLWYGLLQIYPDTARRYGCRAQTGEALKDPTENLSCAARIMNVTVARDNAIAIRDGQWRGVAADWGPMTNRSKIAEMSSWTRMQDYCVVERNLRPRLRPVEIGGAG